MVMTIQRMKLQAIAELVRGASAEDTGNYDDCAIGRAWVHGILERPEEMPTVNGVYLQSDTLAHTAAQLGITKAQAEALFELPFALRPWLDGDHCSRLIYNFLAENPEPAGELPSDEEHGVLEIARAPMSGTFPNKPRDGHAHEWVTDASGLIDDCTLCGEGRA